MDPDEIGRIEFRLAAADDEAVRRRFRRDRDPGWHWTAVAAVAVVSIAAIGGGDASSIGTTSAWRDPGSVVRGHAS